VQDGPGGVAVVELKPGSDAERMLKCGDVIVALDGTKVQGMAKIGIMDVRTIMGLSSWRLRTAVRV
jgi:C-terminal processing protease CtpA/Prc